MSSTKPTLYYGYLNGYEPKG
ncbi:protein of unknown function [Candidatus Promineifilum breve]|uniref:Uncharacterized protein n=1 Tax=Candidatus Promineifilum breve TaxID=1806508 RepID=A0A170PGS1_9CHLR|nr:protein of unknown function [Candidatus Promineifilum breve]